ncbi:MAG: haloacid dehalogenase type II [Acidobacteriota bacterium]
MLNFEAFEVLTFDCYGTLIDWENGLLGALNPIFAAHQIQADDEQLLALYGEFEAAEESGEYQNYKAVLKNVLRRLGKEFDFAPSESELDEFSTSIKHWLPFADTVKALQSLKKKYQLAIISNIDDDLFAFSNERLNVKFDWVITAEQVKSYKPSHNNFLQAIERIAKPKEKILHVAQSIFHDIIPAKQLGIANVWVNRRHGKAGAGATKAAAAQPDWEVTDLQSLARICGIK